MIATFNRVVRPYFEKLIEVNPILLSDFFPKKSAGKKYHIIKWFPKTLWCLLRGFNRREFRIYQLHDLSFRTIATYHSTIDNVRLIERLNDENQLHLLRDKGEFLRRFQHRLGREFLDLRAADTESLTAFLQRHPCFVAKAYNRALGMGIEMLDGPIPTTDIASLRDRLMNEEKFILEEIIHQHPEVSRVYGNCVNSIRIFTLATGSSVTVVAPPMIRFGSQGARIDAYEGLTVLLNPETGDWAAGAVTFDALDVPVHPDTGVTFSSIRIPFLNEAIDLVKIAALEIPELRYIGWDVAITPDGPVLIEGNGAPVMSTMQLLLSRLKNDRVGCRERLAVLA